MLAFGGAAGAAIGRDAAGAADDPPEEFAEDLLLAPGAAAPEVEPGADAEDSETLPPPLLLDTCTGAGVINGADVTVGFGP